MCDHGHGRVRRCLPVADWPEPDREAWAAAHRRGGLLDDDGLAASWAEATSSIIAGGYGRFLSFLAETGDLDLLESPAARITRARVEAYVAQLRERNHSSTTAARILQLVRATAVMAPTSNWTWLRRIRSRLRHMATPARDDRLRLVPAITVRDLGIELMRRAETGTGLSPRAAAVLYRDGLMLCILLACLIRARNFAALSVGTSLQRRGDEWWVCFGPGETKNKRPIEMPLPPAYIGPIERYLDHYRPELLQRSASPVATNALWVSNRGKPLTAKSLGQLVSRRTKSELGRDLNPHLFRKLAATELAIHDPEHVGIGQPLLGHAEYRTTQRNYNLGRALDAARRHSAVIKSLRAQSASPPRRVGRGSAKKPSTRPASQTRLARRQSPRRGRT